MEGHPVSSGAAPRGRVGPRPGGLKHLPFMGMVVWVLVGRRFGICLKHAGES